MTHRWSRRAAGIALAALVAASAAGCSEKLVHMPIANERPTVTLTSAPVDTSSAVFYAYKINWSGYDPDGRIDHYLISIDPAPGDTVWRTSTKNEETDFFRSTRPVLPGNLTDPVKGVDFHTFVIKAVDNMGLPSEPVERVFFSYTVAPWVQIQSPRPNATSTAHVTPAMRITWQGGDPDGQLRQKPVKYKYKLLPLGNPEFDITLASTTTGPDSLRRYYAKTNFASWDSVGGDTTTVQYTGLTPNQTYLFVVLAIDEAGAYNADFSMSTNMVKFQAGYAGTNGPVISAYNEFFTYTMRGGGFAPNDPANWVRLEVPGNTKLTFNWNATPPPGADIAWYRWRIDGDVDDETPRTNEATDWYHWSQKSINTISCQIGPFTTAEEHTLYIESQDINSMLSVLPIKIKVVLPTMNTSTGRNLLIVDDTRYGVDPQFAYATTNWPSASELDTFLYARGGVPWRGTYPSNPPALSKPGILNGYDFDTLGTRLGYENPSLGVPFSVLSQYRHIMWLVDKEGAAQSTMFYMCTPGHNNTFSTYTYAGGKMWLMGGGAAYAATLPYDAKGSDDNNRDFSGISCVVFAGPGFAHHEGKEELTVGRLMYDGAKWQSLVVVQQATGRILVSQNLFRNPSMKWVDQPGYLYTNPVHRPDYSTMPAAMHVRTNPTTDPVYGDPIPPTRPTSFGTNWWNPAPSLFLEYLAQPNFIYEDMNPDAVRESIEVAIDSLYYATGSNLVTDRYTRFEGICMSWYHGPASSEFIFTGFTPWIFRRADCQGLFDFVLKNIWHMNKATTPVAGWKMTTPDRATTTKTAPTRGIRMPAWRAGGK